MRRQKMRRAVAAALALALAILAPSPGNLALAQMKYDDFIQYNDYFPEAHYPMIELEQELFKQIKRYPDLSWSEYSRFPLPPSGALISVKISKKQNILVNLNRAFIPSDRFFGDEEFYHQFGRIVRDTAAELFGRESSGSLGPGSPEPISVYWVFEGKTAFPKQYQPVDPEVQPGKTAPQKKSSSELLANDLAVVPAGRGLFKLNVLGGTGATQAQQTQADPTGFTRVDGGFRELAYPMNAKEWELFEKIQKYFDEVHASGSTDDSFYRQDATRNKLLKVKISTTGNVLVNFDPSFRPISDGVGDDPFFFQLRNWIAGHGIEGSRVRPDVIFVYGGKVRDLYSGGAYVQAGKKLATLRYDDFVKSGDNFTEANLPMTELEQKLLAGLRRYLDDVQGLGPESQAFRIGATGSTLRSVQISEKGNLLINFSGKLKPEDAFYGDEEFFDQFETTAKEMAANLLNRNSGWSKPGDPEPMLVYFAFDGKTAFPGDYRAKMK